MYDVIIIGAGVSGAAAARELSRYQLRVCVLEKEEDVCCGTTKANSAIIHAGYDARPDSLMAKLNVLGSKMMPKLAEELDVPFVQKGSLVVCTNEAERSALEELYQRGLANGVEGLRIVERKELLAMEPNLSDAAVAALYAPTAGIICPFTLNIALAENANENGVDFYFDTEVKEITKIEESFLLHTAKGDYKTKCVVNAAGVYADRFHNMVSADKLYITPRRGDYLLLDKTAGAHVGRTIFALPGKTGKGVLVTPTVHGNLLVGPTAIDVDDAEAVNTTREGLEQVMERCGLTVKNLPLRQVITSFAGLRAHEDGHEFVIRELPDAPGFVDCAGIESPGLSASPAIGRMVADIVERILHPEEKTNFVSKRKGILHPQALSMEEWNALILEQPAYGNIVCRCEKVTEGEIIDAIRRPIGARSLDGVKRRVRAGMGRCQSGFCAPRTMEILARELGKDVSEVTKCGGASRIVAGTNKDSL